MRFVCLALCLALLAGCASGPRIDTRYNAVGQNSRVQYIVLHYTSTDLARSLQLLTEGEVSSHYLIGDSPATIYRLVDEDRRAWHAGVSQWQGRTWLNGTSIGIELVNQSIVQMDGVTQQNAALVEEGAAAAQSLKDQANRLAGAMGQFQLARAA